MRERGRGRERERERWARGGRGEKGRLNHKGGERVKGRGRRERSQSRLRVRERERGRGEATSVPESCEPISAYCQYSSVQRIKSNGSERDREGESSKGEGERESGRVVRSDDAT